MQVSNEHLQKHNSTSSNTKETHASALSSSSTGVNSRLRGSSGTVALGHGRGSRELGGDSARAVGDGDGGGRGNNVDVGVDGGGVGASGGGGADGGEAVGCVSL